MRPAMLKNAAVRGEVFVINSPEHSSFCLGFQNSMMRKTNISEIINSASVRFEDYFLWMHRETKFFPQKFSDFIKAFDKNLFVLMEQNKVVGVSDIPGNFQVMLNKLIQPVQINIGKQLGSQIPQGQTGRETPDYFPKKSPEPVIGSTFSENAQKNLTINGVKKLSHVQLKYPQHSSMISRQLKSQFLQPLDRSVSPFVFSRRPRIKDEDFVPFWLNDPVDGMMEQPVANRCLMNMAAFRIANIKRDIATMLVVSVFQIIMQLKNVVFETYLEFSHVFFIVLVFLEFRPSVEQVLQGNDFIEHKYG